MKYIIKILDKIEEYIILISLTMMVLFIILSVIVRYFELGSLNWAEEASRYLMIILAFGAISLAFKTNSHLGLNFIVDKMPFKYKMIFLWVRSIIIFGFGLLLTYHSFIIVRTQMNFMQVSASMGIPMWWIYSTMVWGGIMIMIRTIQASMSVLIINRKRRNF